MLSLYSLSLKLKTRTKIRKGITLKQDYQEVRIVSETVIAFGIPNTPLYYEQRFANGAKTVVQQTKWYE